MERTRFIKLPIAGQLSHGTRKENGRPAELRIFYSKGQRTTNGFTCKKIQ